MFYTCSRNTQMHGTRKPHQLSYFIPVLGQKRAKTNVRVPTRTIFYYLCQHKKKKTKNRCLFFLFFFSRIKSGSMKGAKLKSLETNTFSLPASLAMVIKAFHIPAQSHRRAHF